MLCKDLWTDIKNYSPVLFPYWVSNVDLPGMWHKQICSLFQLTRCKYERLFLGFLFIVYLFLVQKLIFQIFSDPKNKNLFYSSSLIILENPIFDQIFSLWAICFFIFSAMWLFFRPYSYLFIRPSWFGIAYQLKKLSILPKSQCNGLNLKVRFL